MVYKPSCFVSAHQRTEQILTVVYEADYNGMGAELIDGLHRMSTRTEELMRDVQVGGRLGDVFDEDPRRWRMVAEAFLTVGLALEIATAFSPGNFVLLAGAGNLSKAAGRGMTNPCFRIIQTHFAAANNIGDVAAKEEVRLNTALFSDDTLVTCLSLLSCALQY